MTDFAQTKTDPSNTTAALSWAAYLGCSWTWCIGMFLPVLLVRDYGPWAFLVFALPNVLGAAAMGFVLRSRAQSRAMVEAHRPVMRLFSLVTLAFQIAFLFLVVGPLAAAAGLTQAMFAIPLALLVVAVLRFWAWRDRPPHRGYPLVIGAFLVFSAIQIGRWFLSGGASGVPGFEDAGAIALGRALGTPRLGPEYLAALAPVCLFGFAFCPYLDLTFHRARGTLSPGGSRVAFALGFCVLFASMILFTFAYVPLFWPRYGVDVRPPTALAAAVTLHMLGQLIAKFSIHNEEFGAPAKGGRREAWSLVPALLLAVGLVWFAIRGVAEIPPPPAVGPGSDDTLPWYRVFMASYGLFFPAYVWICVLPGWRRPEWRALRDEGPDASAEQARLDAAVAVLNPTSRQLAVWLASCALAAPAFWLGFLADRPWWLLPGVGVVLLARLVAGPRQPATESPAPAAN